MQSGVFSFSRMEFAGSLGDLGTLIPLSVALMVITGLGATPVLLMIGLFYILSGIYFKLPIPVQPLKLVSAVAIAYPAKITLPVMAAAGMSFGVILLILALSGLVDRIAPFFTKAVMRGIQLGLGFILINKGIKMIMKPELFVGSQEGLALFPGLSANMVLGIVFGLVTLAFISSRRFPAALILVVLGIITGLVFKDFSGVAFAVGPTKLNLYLPTPGEFSTALMLLVIPQMPLTMGNAVMGTADTCVTLFGKGENTKKATYRAFAMSMGLMNTVAGAFGAMPMCHGAGGLAAHYRFGARTGGSNIMIGSLFLLIGLLFGKIAISILTAIPHAVLGVLLLFAGLELAILIRDIQEKNELFIAVLIGGVGFATTNMGIAFILGIIAQRILVWRKISI